MTMGKRREITEKISGPATDALERSLKRPRVENFCTEPLSPEARFSFPDLYNDIVVCIEGNEESFPTIAWNFDDENDTYEHCKEFFLPPSTLSLLRCSKQPTQNSLVRSKSFCSHLSEMNQLVPTSNCLNIFETNMEPLRLVNEALNEEVIDCHITMDRKSSTTSKDLVSLHQPYTCKIQKRSSDHLGLDCF